MPYIKCPDGRTYSRYDQSEYVRWCIKCEKDQEDFQYRLCMSDPACRQQMEHKQHQFNLYFSGMAILMAIFFTFMLVTLFKLSRNNER